jgi:DNA-binding NarL/FixJ family response regulator
MEPIRVLIADSHVLRRAGLRALIEGMGGVEVVAEACDGLEAMRQIASHRPDVLLTEFAMPLLSGLDVAGYVRRDFPMTKSVIVSENPANRAVLSEAVSAGASGFLPRESGAADLRQAIETVARGGSFLSPPAATRTTGDRRPTGDIATEAARILTRRQREVLCGIAQGQTIKSIARDLGISKKTVETHRAALMDRLGINHVAGLVRYAIRHGLTVLDE